MTLPSVVKNFRSLPKTAQGQKWLQCFCDPEILTLHVSQTFRMVEIEEDGPGWGKSPLAAAQEANRIKMTNKARWTIFQRCNLEVNLHEILEELVGVHWPVVPREVQDVGS